MAEHADANVIEAVHPASWPRARGYANGMITAGEGERILFVAGMIGWKVSGDRPEGTFDTDDLGEQFGIALDNVLAVVREASGTPQCIARMTVYVTDLAAYRASLATIGAVWRERLGKHYPVMALVGVAGLVEPRAKVEIEATCVLPKHAPSRGGKTSP